MRMLLLLRGLVCDWGHGAAQRWVTSTALQAVKAACSPQQKWTWNLQTSDPAVPPASGISQEAPGASPLASRTEFNFGCFSVVFIFSNAGNISCSYYLVKMGKRLCLPQWLPQWKRARCLTCSCCSTNIYWMAEWSSDREKDLKEKSPSKTLLLVGGRISGDFLYLL